MNTTKNYLGKDRKIFIKLLEKERQKMLAAGMNEADIFHIHFGEFDENGKSRKDVYPGDYAVWLSERKHIRPDHKYAPGTPQSLESIKYEDYRLADPIDHIADIESKIYSDGIFLTLSELQRHCFVEVRLNGRTQAGVANELGVSRESVKQAISGAVRKLKKFFS